MRRVSIRTIILLGTLSLGMGLLLTLIFWLPDSAGWAHPDFALAFWANFWSDLFVAIPIAGGLAWLISWSKTAKAEIRAEVDIFRRTSGGSVYVLFYLVNTGAVAFRPEEIFWTVYHLGKETVFDTISNTGNSEAVRTDFVLHLPGANAVQYAQGKLTTPLYHDIELPLFEIGIEHGKIGKYTFRYYLSTPYGVIPKRIKARSSNPVHDKRLPMIKI